MNPESPRPAPIRADAPSRRSQPRPPYEAPRLTLLGTVAEVTAGTTGPTDDLPGFTISI